MNRLRSFLISTILVTALPASAQTAKANILDQIGLDQKLDAQIPLNLEFTDESGQTVRLGQYFGQRPVLLTLVYYECPMLCTLVLNGTVRALRTLDFSKYLDSYRRKGAEQGWHFLTGKEDQIKQLADAVGYRYAYDAESKQFAHPSGIILLTPAGKVARYFYGVEYSPRDIRLGMVEAANEKIGSPVDQVLLFCYHYDPATGKYSLAILQFLRLGALLTVAGIGLLLFFLIRRGRPHASAQA